MSKQTISYEQRQLKLEEKMQTLLERKRKLLERQRAKEKDEMRALVLSLGKICVAEGIDDPEKLVACLKSAKQNIASAPSQDPSIQESYPQESVR